MVRSAYDAVVVGAGPNGLSAAIEIARAGLSVCVLEANEMIGGGARTLELTEPGFLHDVCSAIHPMGALSPLFSEVDVERWGVEWIESPLALAHPLDDGPAAVLSPLVDETAASLGPDAVAYRKLVTPFTEQAAELFPEILKPMIQNPSHPVLLGRFGLVGLRSCEGLVYDEFEGERARALFTGCAAHSVARLDQPATASFGLVLLLAAHEVGWPLARRGSASIIAALAACLESLGGTIHVGHRVRSMRDVPTSRAVLFDLTPRQIVAIARDELPASYVEKLEAYRYGPGAFKIDWALDGPVPWRDEACAHAATLHLGGTTAEVTASEAEVAEGRHPDRPFVLFAQQSLFDPTRAPEGRQTGWAYCHVPNGSDVDMTEQIERQVERFAPGFRDRILARHTITAAGHEGINENMVGGDVGGGANTLRQFLARPVARLDPYATPNERLYICSSSTPPGGGVHGMCGYWAARSALERLVTE
jgi:phytoene dehydrogenase-like protein